MISKSQMRTLLISVSIASLLSGLFFFYYGLKHTINSFRSNGWSSVPGVIEESYAKEVEDPRGGVAFDDVVTYAYEVDGVEYSNDKLSFEDGSPGRLAKIEERIAPYPAGMAVDVYYDPNDPQYSVLKPGVASAPLVSAFVGLLAILAGIGAVVYLFRMPRDENHSEYGMDRLNY